MSETRKKLELAGKLKDVRWDCLEALYIPDIHNSMKNDVRVAIAKRCFTYGQ